ncbi:MAG TPA: hypothetical protein VGL02_07855, partial [Streptomyces sp.]
KHKRMPLVRETVKLLAREPRRRWINRHPSLAATELTAAPPDRSRFVEVPDRAAGPAPVPHGDTTDSAGAPGSAAAGGAGAENAKSNGSNGSSGNGTRPEDTAPAPRLVADGNG